MSMRNEQCNKVCRILDDVLANRPTERDFLITAVRKAFGALETEPQWIPCTERLPENRLYVLVTYKHEYGLIDHGITWYGQVGGEWATSREVIAWMPLPEPYAERRTDE